jgi:hypothetical protein
LAPNYNFFVWSSQLHNAQVRAALNLSQVDEALYLQRQQELQRDFQIRQMILQEQIDHQNRIDSMLQEQQLKAIGEHLQEFPDLQQHYHSLLLNEQLQRNEEQALMRERAQMQQQEEMRRRHLGHALAHNQAAAAAQQHHHAAAAAAAHHQQQQHPPHPPQPHPPPPHTRDPAAAAAVASITAARLRDIAADSLAGNAVKRSELEKRTFAKPDEESEALKGRGRSNTAESLDLERKSSKRDKSGRVKRATPEKKGGREGPPGITMSMMMDVDENSPLKPSIQALLDFASSSTVVDGPSHYPHDHAPSPVGPPPPPRGHALGTLEDLLAAASSDEKSDDAIAALIGIKRHVEWSDSEQEDSPVSTDFQIAVKKGETIAHPGFISALPQLPEEPEYNEVLPKNGKFKSIIEEDSERSRPTTKARVEVEKEIKATKETEDKPADLQFVEYPYPIDTWWPSCASVRKERKAAAENPSEDDFMEDPKLVEPDSLFRANIPKIHERLANEVEPGLLEKVPHCKIHRMLMKKRKNPSAPELVYCWQVTELYPNDIMVCCSLCGSWRHAACGGNHKPYSVRESIDTPFTCVCDRCHQEEKILRDFPHARKRIDRQRTEQIRRGLATSAAMRQASFSKHGGSYKWPLGSVSATHIGGHTRSVHSRHDKAEKQWTDMATRLGRGYGYRPKERVKVRTKELERLLVSVEDAGMLP